MKLNKIKLLLSIIGNVIVIYSFSQSNSLDIVSGVDYTYRNLRVEFGDDEFFNQYAKKKLDVLNRLATPRLNFRTGFNLNFAVKDYKEIKFGIRYSALAYNSGLENLKSSDLSLQYLDASGSVNTTSISYGGRFNEIIKLKVYRMIEFPISFKYFVNKGKFSNFAEIGISSLFSINTKYNYTNSNKEIIHDDINRVQFALTISSGHIYSINSKYALFLQPVIRYQLNKNKISFYTERLFNIGVEFGIKKYLEDDIGDQSIKQ